jgi:hypothetical protein
LSPFSPFLHHLVSTPHLLQNSIHVVSIAIKK